MASQDFAGIRRASEHAAEQIVSNCKVKCFMCQEDPRQTMDLIRSMAGEAWVQKSTGWSVPPGACGLTYQDNMAVAVDRIARVDFRDLQKQVEGQMTIFFKGEMIRARSFYANPPLAPSQEVRLNCHLKVQAPSRSSLVRFMNSKSRIRDWLAALAEESAGECEEAVPMDSRSCVGGIADAELARACTAWEELAGVRGLDGVRRAVVAILCDPVPGEEELARGKEEGYRGTE